MRKIQVIVALIALMIAGCKNEEIGNGNDVNPETIFFDYKITAEEDRDYVTVLLQFRYGGPSGTTLAMHPPAKVEFDGVALSVDSSKMTGAFYEHHVAKEDFTGKHVISYTDVNEKLYKEEFEFNPFTITDLPKQIPAGGIELQLEGLSPIDILRVVITDTSFYSEGINRLDTIRGGVLTLTRSDLSKLVKGPVTMELSREIDRPVRNSTPEGGSFALTYSLRRELLLVDSPK